METLPGKDFIEHLKNKNFEAFYALLQSKPNFFKDLSPQKKELLLNSLPHAEFSLIILLVLNEHRPSNSLQIFNNFLASLNAQQIIPEFKSFVACVRDYVGFFLDNNAGIKVLKNLKVAIDKIGEIEPGFNGLYTIFIKLCLQTKNYKAAIPLIERNIIVISKTLDYAEEDLYSYYYYAGHAFLLLKKYDEAVYNFTVCMQVYTRGIHTANVEARKKLILILLRYKKANKVPLYINFIRNINQEDSRSFELLCSRYTEFIARDELLNNPKALEDYLKFTISDAQKENNAGLLKQLSNVPVLNHLRYLKRIYTQYSLDDLKADLKAKKIVDDDTNIKHALFEAFQLKQYGRINSKLNTLVFEKIEDPYNTKSLVKMQERTNQIKDLGIEYNTEHEDLIKGRITNLFA